MKKLIAALCGRVGSDQHLEFGRRRLLPAIDFLESRRAEFRPQFPPDELCRSELRPSELCQRPMQLEELCQRAMQSGELCQRAMPFGELCQRAMFPAEFLRGELSPTRFEELFAFSALQPVCGSLDLQRESHKRLSPRACEHVRFLGESVL